MEDTIVQETLGLTTIVISHQVVTNVDRILEMDGGRIVASGTHEQLLARRGWYAAQVNRRIEGDQMMRVMEELAPGVATAR